MYEIGALETGLMSSIFENTDRKIRRYSYGKSNDEVND